jgi:hypothetical protein
MEFDEDSFAKDFTHLDHSKFQKNGVVWREDNEIEIPSVKLTIDNFTEKITPVLEDYEKYLTDLFDSSSTNMNHVALLSELKTQLAQVRISLDIEDPNSKYTMELWTLREWKERSQYEISVTTRSNTRRD